ncbi:hypothetical protein [Blastomonas fulva]|uniref:hypothetical protein n=1 Tax=Blastomonas fulva TaxID=1550728 RepID=UPI0025A33DAB|nr:hypothetical protein [Blastomonas fulva]MDM7928118.1 hypothetical protein [Blastomonas fulva]MDM7965044.1 hypothetical protein [Blastomonas fulva]
MRTALISLIETVPGGSALRGALPLANGQLAMLQVDLARQAGAGEILCLVGSVGERVRQIEAYAASCGVEFHLVRSVADISVRLASDDELLIIADGLYVAPEEIEPMARQSGTFVASFAPGDGARSLIERFERIDINHVWAGLACVRARDLVEARDLPEDWSVQSALLRLAVQRGYRRQVLPFALAEAGRIAIVRDGAEADALALQELAGSSGTMGARLVRMAPVQALARRAWAARWINPALRVSALALPLGAIGLAVADWSMTALALLVGGRAAGHAADRLFGRFAARTLPAAERAARDLAFALAFIAVTVLTVAASDRLAGLFVSLILPAMALILGRISGPLPRLWVQLARSPSLVAVAAMLAIPFGVMLPALMLWNLILLTLMWWQTRPSPLASDPAKRHI